MVIFPPSPPTLMRRPVNVVFGCRSADETDGRAGGSSLLGVVVGLLVFSALICFGLRLSTASRPRHFPTTNLYPNKLLCSRQTSRSHFIDFSRVRGRPAAARAMSRGRAGGRRDGSAAAPRVTCPGFPARRSTPAGNRAGTLRGPSRNNRRPVFPARSRPGQCETVHHECTLSLREPRARLKNGPGAVVLFFFFFGRLRTVCDGLVNNSLPLCYSHYLNLVLIAYH